MDNWTLLNEVDITSYLPAGFFETVRSAKWTERRDIIQALINALMDHQRFNPKIKYNGILDELKIVITKDSNVVVVVLAIRALTAFVKGLRKNFVRYVPMVLVPLLEKFKEKKASVKDAVVDCLSSIADHCDSTILVGPLCEVLEKNSNPSVKANIDQWIYCILSHYSSNAAPVAFIKNVAPHLVKHSNDGDPEVREGSYMAFGAIMRLVAQKTANSVFDGVFCDKVKSKKIMDYCEKSRKDFETYEQIKLKTVMSLEEPCVSGDNKENDAAMNGGGNQFDAAATSDPWELCSESKICDVIPHDIQTKLASKQWKERKETLETLYKILAVNPRLCPDEDHSELIGALCKILEKDVNVSVAGLAAKCITAFACGLRYQFASHIPNIYAFAFDKLKEKKVILRQPLMELCDALAVLTPLPTYIETVLVAMQKPNPQIKTHTALFISRLLRQHSAHTLPLDCVRQKLVPALVKLGSDADPETRDASFVAIGALMRIVGESCINNCCGEIMQDENKSSKIHEYCANLTKEFGFNASVPVLRLYNSMKPKEITAKAKSDRMSQGIARGKDSKNLIKVTKQVSQVTVGTRPRKESLIMQKQQLAPLVKNQSTRSIKRAFSLAVSSKRPVSASFVKPTYTTEVLHSKTHPPVAEIDIAEAEIHRSDEALNSEKCNLSEKDEFFDASEEMEMPYGANDSDGSVSKNKTFIVESRESAEKCPQEPVVPEASILSQSVCLKAKQPMSVPSCISSLSSQIPRKANRSRIPILLCRRT